MIFGFDCDGILYNFTEGFGFCIPEHRRGEEPEVYGLGTAWGFTAEEFMAHARKGVEDRLLFWTGTPYPEAAEVLRELRQEGHTVKILTHRGAFGEGEALSREATEHWFLINELEYDELHLVEDKTSVPTEAMIEDKIENFLALEASGIDAYLMDRPWNSKLQTEKRVHSLREFKDRALAKTEASS